MGRTVGRRVMAAVAVGVAVAASALLAGQAFAAPAGGGDETAAARTARAQPLAEGTPCSVVAKACVDLESQQAWLLEDGKVTRGPVAIASGGKGEETPVGHSLNVYRKEEMHLSNESRAADGTPDEMPWSVFFEDGGIAFHSGNPEVASAGCIHLETDDAKAWYAYLQIGDRVEVVKKSEELAARGLSADGND
ncbi:L,D-transpeptidase [Pseudonocardia sp. TRM90224]|uniref:L,D-transpeptidase n=1 Tax=Pseudonocardia sp. TRM90224 TaxID=2812678 RepID=UPI001E59EC40|nr:L,D-transpeptidase [Pseudonocardia sp. TRM90224]